MTGGGAPGAAGILQCLKADSRLDIFLADANPDAVGRYLHPQFLNWPVAADPAFGEKVLEICRQNRIDVLMPLVTLELPLLAAIADKLQKQGTKVLVSPADGLDTVNDKGKLYRHAASNGLNLPDWKIATNETEWNSAMDYFAEKGQPFTVKPCVSNGSRGFRIVSEDASAFHRFFSEKPSQVYISVKEIKALFAEQTFPPMLVTDYLPGPEYSVDVLVWEGKIKSMVPRVRTRMNQGISVAGTIDRFPEVTKYCKALIDGLPLIGNIGVQVKEDENGKPALLEINPRVQGTISAGLGAGVNLPLWAVQLALGETPAMVEPKWGTHFQRIWHEVFY